MSYYSVCAELCRKLRGLLQTGARTRAAWKGSMESEVRHSGGIDIHRPLWTPLHKLVSGCARCRVRAEAARALAAFSASMSTQPGGRTRSRPHNLAVCLADHQFVLIYTITVKHDAVTHMRCVCEHRTSSCACWGLLGLGSCSIPSLRSFHDPLLTLCPSYFRAVQLPPTCCRTFTTNAATRRRACCGPTTGRTWAATWCCR